jgi:hypothetical protein
MLSNGVENILSSGIRPWLYVVQERTQVDASVPARVHWRHEDKLRLICYRPSPRVRNCSLAEFSALIVRCCVRALLHSSFHSSFLRELRYHSLAIFSAELSLMQVSAQKNLRVGSERCSNWTCSCRAQDLLFVYLHPTFQLSACSPGRATWSSSCPYPTNVI